MTERERDLQQTTVSHFAKTKQISTLPNYTINIKLDVLWMIDSCYAVAKLI